MRNIRIFVEGNEWKFLLDYINHLGLSKNFDRKEIISVGGWTKLDMQYNKFVENTDQGGVNLIIFDANKEPDNRKREIIAFKQKLTIEFELFLLPDNSHAGNFETLLEQISHPQHKCIFDCFNKYQDCLESQNKNYNLPNPKAKIFAYLETLNVETNDEKRNYLDTNCWDLNHRALEPLKNFLLMNFSQNQV